MRKVHRRDRRISVSVPSEMYDDFKLRANAAGISVSRLLYLLLRKRKDFVIAPAILVSAIRGLRKEVAALAESGSGYTELRADLDSLLKSLSFLEGAE